MDIYTIRALLKTKSIYDIELRVTYYARVSSEKDEQLNSLDNQISYYEDLIKKNSAWTFVEGYVDEGLSGMSTKKRENFNRMVEDAKKGLFDLVITKEITRFARNTLDSIQYTRELLNNGVAVYFQNDNINTLDEDSELRLTIMSGIAQDELRKLSSRVKFGHQQAIKSKVVLGNNRMWGYLKNNGKLVIDETQAPLVRKVFELYATGEYGLARIRDILYEQGYRTDSGKRIEHSALASIIKNPKYKGYYAGNKVTVVDMFSKKRKFFSVDEWVLWKDETGEIVPAIVDERTWNAANEVLKRRSEDVKNRRGICNHNNLLTGKMRCAHCGQTYFRRQLKLASGEIKTRWVCGGKLKNGANTCSSITIYEDQIKPILFEVFNSTKDTASQMIERYIEAYTKAMSNNDVSKQIDEMQGKLNELNRKKRKLLQFNMDGIITDEDFKELMKETNDDIDRLKDEMMGLESQRETDEQFKERIAHIRNTLEEAKNVASRGMITRQFVDKYISNILVTPISKNEMRLDITICTGETITKVHTGQTIRMICTIRNRYKEDAKNCCYDIVASSPCLI